MEYAAPFGQPDPDASYVNGSPGSGIEGSIPPAAAIEHPQREIVAAIVGSGQTPDDGDLGQLWAAIRGTFSLAAPGWQKLPSGLLIQWGTAVAGASGNVTSTGTVTWPTAFPTACRVALASPGGGANSGSGYLPSCGFTSFSTTSGNLVCDTLTGGSATPVVFNQTVNIRWLALGN